MKKRKMIVTVIFIFTILLSLYPPIYAHGGNITGWKEKNSENIKQLDGKYYGFHKESGVVHYHQVKWDDKNSKWTVVDSKVYYDSDLKRSSLDQIKEDAKAYQKKSKVTYKSVVDGDTAKFIMEDKEITVRFLAVDTPESKHPTKGEEPFGKEASNYTKERLEKAKEIYLEFDYNSDEKDKYDRYLAWIWVDDILLQKDLVKHGLARVAYLYADYKYTPELQVEEKIAKENKLKIWGLDENENTVDEENFIQKEVSAENIVSNTINQDEEQQDLTMTIAIPTAVVIGIGAILSIFGVNGKKKRSSKKRKK